VENDANLFTLGEAIYGAGKDRRFVIGVTLGTGVGGGLVINGEIIRGAVPTDVRRPTSEGFTSLNGRPAYS